VEQLAGASLADPVFFQQTREAILASILGAVLP
jgi:hypothetical protein